MKSYNTKRKQYNLLEITFLMALATMSATTLNFYYYDTIDLKLKKLKIASNVLAKHKKCNLEEIK
ncbi:MAG: hypothetical protein HN576_09325 [Bacteriovoracaceae bacterium]|jgi:hypothetical protein|nr:hypothetical protein [Bacteriovoracaceae bacterium]